MTEVDHKDGNRENNDPGNLDELCPMCHKYKGRIAGDYNNQKNKPTLQQKSKPSNNQVKKSEAFHRMFNFLESDNDEETYNESAKRVA